MKKTLLVILALIMTVATVATTVAFSFAADAAEQKPIIDATHNPVTVDGVLSFEEAIRHKQNALDKTVLDEVGTPYKSEFIMTTEVGATAIGAAWDQAEGKVYFAIKADGLIEAEIILGGKTFTADLVNAAVDGGEAAVNDEGSVAEIALPIEGIEMGHNGRNVTADLSITVAAVNGEDKFDGVLAFSQFAAGFAYGKNFSVREKFEMLSPGATEENRMATVVDANTAVPAYEYALFTGVSNVTKNVTWKMDLNVEAMPYTNPVSDGPSAYQSVKEARFFLSFKWRANETWYACVQNTADNGLVFVVQTNAGAFTTPGKTVINLGKQTGELFNLEVEWNEDNSLVVYVDGVKVGNVDNALNIDANLGSQPGVLYFYTVRGSAYGIGEEMKVKYGNIAVNEKLAEYDEAALLALASNDVEIPTETTAETTVETTVETTDDTTAGTTATTTADTTDDTTADGTDADTTAAPEATTADTTAPAEDEGCASSLALYGAVMVIGTALTAVVATSKKKED